DEMFEWIGGEHTHDELIAAFDRLDSLPEWIDVWDGSRQAQAQLKNLTSKLIGRFAHSSTHATRSAYPQKQLARFGASVIIPAEISAEIAVLKGIVAAFVMKISSRQPVYTKQREILTELADTIWATGDQHLDAAFSDDWSSATDDAARKRIVVDQIASLTDQGAFAWYERVVGN
ncbi:MAG: hypothetical protein RL441_1469, partial [Actinomycetota bacterium]